jgi:hypothetical protein
MSDPAAGAAPQGDNRKSDWWFNWFAYVLSVLASLMGFMAAAISAKHWSPTFLPVALSVSIGLVLMSVLNTPLTLLVKWKSAIHVFYAYHLAVHCLLIVTVLSGIGDMLSRPSPLDETGAVVSVPLLLFLAIYALSLWGLASRYRKSIQRESEATIPDTVDPRGPKGK